MGAIFKKELNHFFNSFVGYIAIVVFLITVGFFVWINSGSNLLDFEFAQLDLLFQTAPLILMLIIPAITMRSFAEEYSSGTMEILLTKSISKTNLLFGKFLASLLIAIIAILPTLIYVFTIFELGMPKGNLDIGSIVSSYIGLIFLSGAFCSVGIFTSAISKNQIVAFIMGLFLCYFFYRGFNDISKLPIFYGSLDETIQNFGLSHHFAAIQKGVLDTRDLVYFTSFISLFLAFCAQTIKDKK